MSKQAALEVLLREMFNDEELRIFLWQLPGSQALLSGLPGGSASLSKVAFEAIGLLERHGSIDDEFFDALVKSRPRLQSKIAAVAAMWRVTPSGASVDPRAEFLKLAESIYHDLAAIQTAIAAHDINAADDVLKSVVSKTRTLYTAALRLRALESAMSDDSLAAFDAVYEVIAKILNNKGGNIFDVALAIKRAKDSLRRAY